jgi:uncharacterized membrane-anchored protein YitT (DUF2179 family)
MTPYRVGIKGSANWQKLKFKIFKNIPILAHSAKKIPKAKTLKTSPGYSLLPCQISSELLNYKDFHKHFKIFLVLELTILRCVWSCRGER